MSLICKDCGCDDVRNYPDIGYACNNCGSKDYKQFDRNHMDKETKDLMENSNKVYLNKEQNSFEI